MQKSIFFDDPSFARIDLFLASREGLSRSFFSRLIESGAVLVNGKVISKSGFCPKIGDCIEFCTAQSIVEVQNESKSVEIEFKVIDEQDDFLVIDKPAGLLVHSTSPNCSEPSLVQGLDQRFLWSKSMPKELRGGIVHRLDKETSGLILVAKNVKAQSALSKLFCERKINKTYLAIVCGRLEKSGKIIAPIGRHPVHRHKRMVYGVAMKEASSEFQCLENFGNFSLAKVKIFTGRTHQIRVHMAWLGHPILGDFLYGQKSEIIARQALHASTLEFVFDGRPFSYKADLPSDMTTIIESGN